MIKTIMRKYRKLLLSMVVVCALGIGTMTGLSASYISLEKNLDEYVESYAYPDAVITTETLTKDKVEDLMEVEGIEAVDARLAADTVIESPDGELLSIRAFSYSEEDHMKMYFWSEAEPDKGQDAILVEYEFAETNRIRAGDTVKAKIGDEYRPYFVSGIVSLPEALSVRQNRFVMSVAGDFGYVYVPESLLAEESLKEKEKAEEELDEKSGELQEAKDEAEIAYNDLLDQIGRRRAELDRLIGNYPKTKAELKKKLAELEEKEEELRSDKAELLELKALLLKAKSGLRKIDDALGEAQNAYSELTDTSVVRAVDLLRNTDSTLSLYDLADSGDMFLEFLEAYSIYNPVVYFYFDQPVSLSAVIIEGWIERIESDYTVLSADNAAEIVQKAESGDQSVIESEEYKKIEKAASNYIDGSLTSETYREALDSVTELHNYVVDYNLEVIAAELKNVNDMTLLDLLEQISKLDSYASRLSKQTGKEIDTVGELVEAYDSAVADLQDTIAELKSQRSEIVQKLKKNGVAEDEIGSVLATLTEGLSDIRSGLRRVRKAEKQIRKLLSSGNLQLIEGGRLLDQKTSELNAEWAKQLKEFSGLEDELDEAYRELDENEGYQDLCNQFLIYFRDGSDPEATLELAEEKLGDADIKDSFVYKDSAVMNSIRINVDPIHELAVFMPWVFFIVVLIVLFLFMTMLVRQCRTDIGIMRALGYTKNSIRGSFSAVGLCVSLASYLPGILIGWILISLISNYYYHFFSLPFIVRQFDGRTLILSIVITVITAQAATLSGTSLISRIRPSEAMTREVPDDRPVPKIVQALTKRAGELVKFSVISMMRNPLRFVISVICIASTSVLIFSSMSFLVSKNTMLHQTFDQRILHDGEIFMSEEADDRFIRDLNDLGYISETEKANCYFEDVCFGGRSASVNINTIPAGSDMIGIFDKNGETIAIEDSGIILDRYTAEYIGAAEGDTVRAGGIPMKVIGLSDQAISRIQYVSEEQGKALGKPDLGGVLIRIDQDRQQDLIRYLADRDGYLSCSFTDRMLKMTEELYETYDLYAWILVGFAVVIGLIIVVNISNIIMLEQKRELCVLRALGFTAGELSGSLFSQSMIRFVCSMLIGIPVGGQIARHLLKLISTWNREFIYASGLQEVIITSLIVFIYVVAAHLISMRTMRDWDIAECVKDKE